jgi:hypothetical protein
VDSESLHRCSCMLGLDWPGARSRRLREIECAMCTVQDEWQGFEIVTGLASVGRVNRNRILHNTHIAHRTSPCLGRTTNSVYCNTLLQGTNRDRCRGCDVAIVLHFLSTLSRTKPCRSELYRLFFQYRYPLHRIETVISLSFYSIRRSRTPGHPYQPDSKRVDPKRFLEPLTAPPESWLSVSIGPIFSTFSIDRTRVQSLCIQLIREENSGQIGSTSDDTPVNHPVNQWKLGNANGIPGGKLKKVRSPTEFSIARYQEANSGRQEPVTKKISDGRVWRSWVRN